MHILFGVDWRGAFTPDTPLFEIFLRGSIIYLVIFGLLRFVINRQAGAVGISDLLVTVLIADPAQNAMAANYQSLPDGILLVSTIVFWAYLLDWLGYHSQVMERVIQPKPLVLVRDGQPVRRNMRRELITMGELLGELRLQGSDDLAEVKKAIMESDGRISFVMKDNQPSQGAPERPAV